MKIKHVSPPSKVWGTFFLKKALHEGANFFWANLLEGCFTWGIMIRSWKGAEKVPQIHFPVI